MVSHAGINLKPSHGLNASAAPRQSYSRQGGAPVDFDSEAPFTNVNLWEKVARRSPDAKGDGKQLPSRSGRAKLPCSIPSILQPCPNPRGSPGNLQVNPFDNGSSGTNTSLSPDTAFKQQRLKSWQPILTPKSVLPTLFVLGAIFAPIGGIFLALSDQVLSLSARLILRYWKFPSIIRIATSMKRFSPSKNFSRPRFRVTAATPCLRGPSIRVSW